PEHVVPHHRPEPADIRAEHLRGEGVRLQSGDGEGLSRAGCLVAPDAAGRWGTHRTLRAPMLSPLEKRGACDVYSCQLSRALVWRDRRSYAWSTFSGDAHGAATRRFRGWNVEHTAGRG